MTGHAAAGQATARADTLSGPRLEVREMRPDEVRIRVDYFHGASEGYLSMLGVDRHLLPSPAAWEEHLREELSRPVGRRDHHALVWELDGLIVGFSTADRIRIGVDAFMHLHLLDAARRGGGLGARFVTMSADEYLRVLELERLFCEPNALNVAPNRTLQRAGFRYLFSHECTPGPINVPQVTTRWVLEPVADDGDRGRSDSG